MLSEEAMEEDKAGVTVGAKFASTKLLPPAGQCRVVQVDISPELVGNRIPTEVPLVGDARETLGALLPLLRAQDNRTFLEKAQAGMAKWRDEMAALEDPDREPIAPQYLMGVIDRLADDDAILSADSGTIATWSARHWTIRNDRQFYLSGNLATMAPGLPYAMAHQWAFPGRQCIAFVGDGGFAMLMAEFETAVRYGLPIKVVVNNNGALGQILWEQMVLGYPEFGVRFQQYANFAPWAEACGGLGVLVEKPGDLERAVAAAFAHPGPALLDVRVNPDEPPMPGKVTRKQALKFAEAFLRGQPRKATIASTLFRDKISELNG